MNWTKVSNSLPKENSIVLLTVEIDGKRSVMEAHYGAECHDEPLDFYAWDDYNQDTYAIESVYKIIAWMPYPEPYQE